MVSALFIFSYLPHNTLFFQTPYYQALSGIIGSKFAVLLLYYGSKWVNFLCPKCPQTSINADFYLSTDFIVGNGETYPFEAWNADQTLQSAMNSSVNWYFQAVDEQLGTSDVYSYVQEIGYGNENMSGDFSSYWMESSLEISPIEQVELLTKLQNNSFGFAPENINAVKDAICLSASDAGTFYGKTGTGRVNGQDVNGWFIGYIETADNTYFFATNISADSDATGGNATEITMSILSDMNIWK